MKWHCVVEISKYCNGTPEWAEEPAAAKGIKGRERTEEVRFYSGGTCKLTPETCGRCQGILEQIPPEELERIKKSTYIETIIPISPKEKAENKDKPKESKKSKAAKKLEQEMAQRSMF